MTIEEAAVPTFLLARVESNIVGRGVVELPGGAGSTTAFVSLEVLPDFREAGGRAAATDVDGRPGRGPRSR